MSDVFAAYSSAYNKREESTGEWEGKSHNGSDLALMCTCTVVAHLQTEKAMHKKRRTADRAEQGSMNPFTSADHVPPSTPCMLPCAPPLKASVCCILSGREGAVRWGVWTSCATSLSLYNGWVWCGFLELFRVSPDTKGKKSGSVEQFAGRGYNSYGDRQHELRRWVVGWRDVQASTAPASHATVRIAFSDAAFMHEVRSRGGRARSRNQTGGLEVLVSYRVVVRVRVCIRCLSYPFPARKSLTS